MRLIIFLYLAVLSLTTTAQNLGIGIINPVKARLEVFGAVSATSAIFGGDGSGISLQRNYPAIGFNQYYSDASRAMVPGNAMVQYLEMSTGALCIDGFSAATQPNNVLAGQLRRLTIRQNGNVSINYGPADASLFVGPSAVGITNGRLRGTSYHSTFAERVVGQPTQHTYINAGKNGSDVFINDESGGNIYIGGGTTRVGINSADPTGVLELKQVNLRGLVLVEPAGSFYNWEFAVNHEAAETESDLWMYFNEQYRGNFYHVDGMWYAGSDRRLKTNIVAMPSVLSRVLKMRPVQYVMKFQNPGKIKSTGFIAQELRSIFPEITDVSEGSSHGYAGVKDLVTVNYDAIGVIALKAIQEQQLKIKSLKERNAALRARIDAAEKTLATAKK